MVLVSIIEGILIMHKSQKLMWSSWLSFAMLILVPLLFPTVTSLLRTSFWLGSIMGMSLLAAGIVEKHRGNYDE